MRMDDGGADAPDAVDGAAAGGTLVIRTWFEPGREPGFRARIIYSQAAGGQSSVAASDREEVLEVVRQWLEAQ